MSYRELYDLFISRNPKLKPFITDFRPSGKMSLEIWFDNGMSLVIFLNEDKQVFELI